MGKIISLKGHAAGRDVNVQQEPGVYVEQISGGMNVLGNNATVHIYRGISRPLVEPIPPPPDHITEEQAATLKRLHSEWVELSANVKTRAKPITPQQAWIAINRVGRSTTYKHIRQANYDAVCAYIQQQMAILRSGKTARSKDPKWRTSRIGAIKARSIKQLGDQFAYLAYIAKNFKAGSLTELDDEQLEATYRYVLKLKPKL